LCAFIGCHCKKLVDEKNTTVLLCKCFFRGKNIDQRCTSYKLKTTTVKKKVDFSYE